MKFSPRIISNTPTTRRFPILAQLSILIVIVLVLFRAWWWPGDDVAKVAPVALPPAETIPQYQTETLNAKVQATAAYVWDVKAGRALYAKNADQALPLASITKLMTALLAYETVSDQAQASISNRAVKQDGSSGLSVGEQISMGALRELALVSSSNDAAYALAANTGALLGDKNPETQFVAGMNIRAEELQLPTLNFSNTTGLDISATRPGAVGSARDVSLLMAYIVSNYPELIDPTKESAARIYNTAGAYHEANNTNEIATAIPNMLGSKTGYTDLAGGNLTVAFDAGNDRPVVVTVLGSTRDQRFTDVLTLVKATTQAVGRQ